MYKRLVESYTVRRFIPNNIFQTHQSQEYIDSNKKLVSAQNSWKQHSNYNYYFYDNEACDKFMKEEFSNIYHIYKNLDKPVMKADMWRYCIIYKYGGIYADADTVCKVKDLDNIFNKDTQLVGVPENNVHMCNWIFASQKGSSILKSVIDLIVERSVEKNQGVHYIHYKTGPGVYTSGIENWLKENNLETYNNKEDYARYKDNNMYIYEPNIFHNKYVIHLFSGQWKDGWTKNI